MKLLKIMTLILLAGVLLADNVNAQFDDPPPVRPSNDRETPAIKTSGSKAGESRSDNGLKDSTGNPMMLKWCPPGTYKKGNEFQKNVTVSGFWIAKTEVSQDQYKAIMSTNPSPFRRERNPVTNVDLTDAETFFKKLNQQESMAGRLPKGWKYMLPTDDQWEYACRAGSTTHYCFGDDASKLTDYAWTRKNSGFLHKAVGTRKANAWGIHDMHGNVLELCRDRCIRGGGASYPDEFHQSHYRMVARDSKGNSATGFRIILAPFEN